MTRRFRPMKTAPKDGTRILIATGPEATEVARWEEDGMKVGRWLGDDRSYLVDISVLGWLPLPVMSEQQAKERGH